MSILIVGATGFVGGEIACKLASRGRKVAGLVRGGSAHAKGCQLANNGVTIVPGELAKPNWLAVSGVETIVCTAIFRRTGTDDSLRRIGLADTLALIDDAQQQGARKFVHVSCSGNIREDSPLETPKRQCAARLPLPAAPEDAVVRTRSKLTRSIKERVR